MRMSARFEGQGWVWDHKKAVGRLDVEEPPSDVTSSEVTHKTELLEGPAPRLLGANMTGMVKRFPRN